MKTQARPLIIVGQQRAAPRTSSIQQGSLKCDKQTKSASNKHPNPFSEGKRRTDTRSTQILNRNNPSFDPRRLTGIAVIRRELDFHSGVVDRFSRRDIGLERGDEVCLRRRAGARDFGTGWAEDALAVAGAGRIEAGAEPNLGSEGCDLGGGSGA